MPTGRGIIVAAALIYAMALNALSAEGSVPGERFPDTLSSQPPLGTQAVKIFVTNDVHGYVFEDEGHKRIGYALLKGYIEAARRQGCASFLLDAGDTFSGNALAQYDAGLGVARLMGYMGYRVIAPGNHAFDYNASTGNMRYYTDVLLETLAATATESFEATCVNLTSVWNKLPHLTGEPLVLAEGNGVRIVVAGVLTPYARSSSSPENTDGHYDFGLVKTNGRADHAATKTTLLERLSEAIRPYDRPGDVVIVLLHVGNDDTADYSQGQVRGTDLASVPNVDFVVDAHSHNHIPVRAIGPVQYCLPGRYLERFAEITLYAEGNAVRGNMELVDYDQIKESAEPSLEMLGRLRELSDRMGLGEELFLVRDDLLGDDNISSESTPLGRLLCTSMNDISGADLSILNSGSLRSGIAPGWVTLGTLYDMMPFQNDLVTFSMTGGEIADLFHRLPPRRTNAFPQFGGMTVYAWDQGNDRPLGIAGIRDRSGKPLNPERTYTVAVNSFMAEGGDGYSFNLVDKRNHGDLMALLVNRFRNIESADLESFRKNDALLIYPDREVAQKGFMKTAEESREGRNK
jgi:5''-nucleotidase/2'',3''-cyclic phosphodiesterase and related esterases